MINYKSYFFSQSKSQKSVNQDSIISPIVIDDYIIFAIADGVGGVAHGDKASEFITKYCKKTMEKSPQISLKALFENLWISFNDYAAKNNYLEMASTFTFCRIGKSKFEIAHVGDCRVYIKTYNKSITQITKDHTALSNIKVRYNKDIEKYYSNLITSSFSTYEKYKSDFIEHTTLDIDYICILSDGVYKYIDEKKLISIFSYAYDAEDIGVKLKKAVQNNNPKDDYSAIIVQLY